MGNTSRPLRKRVQRKGENHEGGQHNGREQELHALQTTTQTNSVQTQSDLSNLTGVDMVTAISKFEQTQSALQAAQQTFVKMQGMSLFQYIGN